MGRELTPRYVLGHNEGQAGEGHMEVSFEGIIAFAFMATMLLAGVILRARFFLFRNLMIPASLIGGSLGFLLITGGWSFGYEAADFAAFTFHFFTLSFMSLCLTGAESTSDGPGPTLVRGGFWFATLWMMSLVMQGVLGFAVISAFNLSEGQDISPYLGFMVAHGFTQGPGQAVSFGNLWEGFGVTNALSVGLIYASLGFVVAFVVGVPIARWVARRSQVNAQLGGDLLSGILSAEHRDPIGHQITHSSNAESFAYHIGLLGLAYLLTHVWMNVMLSLVGDMKLGEISLAIFFSPNLFFFHGLVTCFIMRALIDATGLAPYLDNETQKTITGGAVDFMIVGTLMSIQFAVLEAYLVPILTVSAVVTVATIILCFGFGRQVQQYGVERALTSFGCCCGSAGTGLLLLRIVDPGFRTPIARELALFNVVVIFVGFHILMVMAPILPQFGVVTVLMVYGATFAAGFIIMRLLGAGWSVPVTEPHPQAGD